MRAQRDLEGRGVSRAQLVSMAVERETRARGQGGRSKSRCMTTCRWGLFCFTLVYACADANDLALALES